MLAWRLFLAPILIGALVTVFALDARLGDSAPFLWILATALVLRGTWELVELLRVRSFDPSFGLLAILGPVIISANWLPVCLATNSSLDGPSARLGLVLVAFCLSVMILFACSMVRYRAPGRTLETLGAQVLTLTYLAVFISLTLQLRWLPGPGLGYLPLASLVVVTKCGDSAAYFAGHLFGGKKMSPLISPGKTWAGAVGAVIGSAAGSWAWIRWGTPAFTDGTPGAWYWAVLYGVVVGVVGMVGDLAESLIKRDVGKKDSAPLLPGFGGLLDLLDSVIFAGPAAYVLWVMLPLVIR